MKVVYWLRNITVGFAAAWALFSVLAQLEDGGGIDGQRQLSSIFFVLLIGTFLALAAFVLAEICQYVLRRDT
jgi:hypothetical protein